MQQADKDVCQMDDLCGGRRDDEVLAIKEIFEDAIGIVQTLSSNLCHLELSIRPELSDEVTVTSTVNGKSITKTIKHLPSVRLNVDLDHSYPEHDHCPKFFLVCCWLSQCQTERLRSELESLWFSLQSEILFTWIQFLKNDLVSTMNVVEIDIDKCFQSYNQNVRQSGSEYLVFNRSRDLFDFLIAFNEEKQFEDFSKTVHECEVCNEEKPGMDCVKFQPCQHVFCLTCTSEFFNVNIKDGTITKLRCLSSDCDSEPTQADLRRVLPEHLFQLVEKQQLKVALESMNDVVTCPRATCETPVIADLDSNLALCQHCSFSFCKLCMRSYHGVEMCTVRDDRVREIREEYERGDPLAKRQMEQKYGKQQLLKFVNESRSLEWMNSNAKSCPSCHIQTQKTKGCNKMWCARCGCHWCWLCNAHLRSNNPYAHFMKQSTQCFQKLFDGMTREELVAQFEGFEDEEVHVQHARPRPNVAPAAANRAPVVEVHIAPNVLGLGGVDDGQNGDGAENRVGGMQEAELDIMALQLQQQLIEDDQFQVEIRDDGLLYAQLQP